MSLKSVKKISANRCELEVEVNKSEFEKGLNSAHRRTAKRYSIPGFRKGHAPRSFIEKRYGEGIFYEEAFNILCPEFLDAAVKEAKLDTVPDKIDLGLEGLGIGDWAQSPIPNPQSPIPNPHFKIIDCF